MIQRKAYKFRLQPSPDQAQQLHVIAGHCRFLWNKVLGMNLERLESKQPLMWYHEVDYWSKHWKRSEEYGFLREAPAQCLQQKLMDLSKAFKDCFDKSQPLKRLPRFKRRGQSDGFRFPEPKHIHIDNRRVKLPKLGWIRFKKSRAIEGTLKNATITRSAGKWYVSFQVATIVETPIHSAKSIVGIDLGVASFAALSTGQIIDSIHAFKAWRDKLATAQRRLAKKKKFSENWKKQKRKIQAIHSKIANVRRDFQHKASTALSKSHAMVVVEALKITNMSASAKGSINSPGKNVKAKSDLNRSILDQAWGELKRQLAYKLEWLGGELIEVPAAYTSQTCAACRHVDKVSRPSQELFCCTHCGHTDNADVNAAKNILEAGKRAVFRFCQEDREPERIAHAVLEHRKRRPTQQKRDNDFFGDFKRQGMPC